MAFFLKFDSHKCFITPDDLQVETVFKRITSKLDSNDEKARACFHWVRANIKYVLEEKGEDKWRYPKDTLDRKYGDCEDQAFLLCSFLHLAKQQYYFAREIQLGNNQFHAFVIVINNPEIGLNYWDTTTDKRPPFSPSVVFEAINRNGIANPLGFVNFIPALLPLR